MEANLKRANERVSTLPNPAAHRKTSRGTNKLSDLTAATKSGPLVRLT